MGIGDFGDWLVPEAVENAAGAARSAAGNSVEAASDLGWGLIRGGQTAGKGLAHVSNPGNWNEIGNAIIGTGQFVAEHPGAAWDIGFEVGRHVVKEEILDPQNLAINLGLTAATIATGGGAGAAWLGKAGTAGRAGASAFRAAKASGGGISAARAYRAASTSARASEAAFQAVRAERVAARGFRALDTAEDVSETSGMFGRIGEGVTRAAEALPTRVAELRQSVGMNPMSLAARGRGRLAASFEGGSPGMMREAVGDVIRGSAYRPSTAGLGGRSSRFAESAYRVNRGETYKSGAETFEQGSDVAEEVYEIQKNPEAYAAKKGVNVAAIRGAYQLFRQGKKLMGEEEGEEKSKKKVARPVARHEYSPMAVAEAPTSSFRGQQTRGGPGTSESEYVESDFSVGRLDQFQRGLYDPRTIYEKAGAR